jgi:hypothetical protein
MDDPGDRSTAHPGEAASSTIDDDPEDASASPARAITEGVEVRSDIPIVPLSSLEARSRGRRATWRLHVHTGGRRS